MNTKSHTVQQTALSFVCSFVQYIQWQWQKTPRQWIHSTQSNTVVVSWNYTVDNSVITN